MILSLASAGYKDIFLNKCDFAILCKMTLSLAFAEYKNIFLNKCAFPILCVMILSLAYKAKNIASYNIWNGKLSLKIGKDDRDIYISHIDDLINIGLASDEDILEFLNPVRNIN